MLQVRIFQHHRQCFAGTARQVVLPAQSGELSVLEYHAPMLCALASGAIQIDDAAFMVRGGLARVDRNLVTIMAR